MSRAVPPPTTARRATSLVTDRAEVGERAQQSAAVVRRLRGELCHGPTVGERGHTGNGPTSPGGAPSFGGGGVARLTLLATSHPEE